MLLVCCSPVHNLLNAGNGKVVCFAEDLLGDNGMDVAAVDDGTGRNFGGNGAGSGRQDGEKQRQCIFFHDRPRFATVVRIYVQRYNCRWEKLKPSAAGCLICLILRLRNRKFMLA